MEIQEADDDAEETLLILSTFFFEDQWETKTRNKNGNRK